MLRESVARDAGNDDVERIFRVATVAFRVGQRADQFDHF
jgi:hypothetical protein